jgi:hypothetical protein
MSLNQPMTTERPNTTEDGPGTGTIQVLNSNTLASHTEAQNAGEVLKSTPSVQEKMRYGLRVKKKSSLFFIQFLLNSIHIYGSKSIYYENTFHN